MPVNSFRIASVNWCMSLQWIDSDHRRSVSFDCKCPAKSGSQDIPPS